MFAAINFAMLFTDAATWGNVIAVLLCIVSGTYGLIVASRQPATCHVCGHRGMVRQMTKRGGRRVCRNVAACTERVMNPQPVRRAYTLEDLQKLRTEHLMSYPQRVVLGHSKQMLGP